MWTKKKEKKKENMKAQMLNFLKPKLTVYLYFKSNNTETVFIKLFSFLNSNEAH